MNYLHILPLIGIGLATLGISGYMAQSSSTDISTQSEDKVSAASCGIWRKRSRTAGIETSDKWEEKFNENCGGRKLDQIAEENDFFNVESKSEDSDRERPSDETEESDEESPRASVYPQWRANRLTDTLVIDETE